MNKIIAAFDGLKLSESVIDYAIWLYKEYNDFIVAVFLEETNYLSRPVSVDMWGPHYTSWDKEAVMSVTKKDATTQENSVLRIKKKFEPLGMHYKVHKEKTLALESLLMESHFADMILIDANTSFSNTDKSSPPRFIHHLLCDTDCPVILVPGKFKPIERFVFAYDGSPASAYAIRQFTYLFPFKPGREIEIVMATETKSSTHFPHQQLLKELLQQKYTTVLQSVLRDSNTEDTLFDHLRSENKNCLVVMGAYERSAFSMWLHHSAADRVIKELAMPLFIAHH